MTTSDDRVAIEQVLHRYARAVDRLDYDGIRDCYFPDAIDNHGGYHGPVDGLIEDIRQRHATIDSSQHFISNVLIDFTGEGSAEVESYCLCYLRQAPEDGSSEQELATIRCRYVDRFERRGGRWRIADRIVVFDEYRTQRVTDRLNPAWVRSRRDATDPVYRR
ncbi:nuclear transport factor 2 family protein [Saccharopolyspora phatthalungensis]|uniref:3-phenylpropionate/cinnamic acid dioxygenase small subunit n=1 Tax=Saccharopolyspora phatthalungensis TaxID=664693 RepID=A0A840QB90_9PSEU|nr:nuclear transport factor 2 family protein [Saccharopolyspora phatthalungensis]MBB5158024.1 3-phenylpropionate/cinnamic acid dioxygenase small subunit [Saccharopolyspora phatthalungensis]